MKEEENYFQINFWSFDHPPCYQCFSVSNNPILTLIFCWFIIILVFHKFLTINPKQIYFWCLNRYSVFYKPLIFDPIRTFTFCPYFSFQIFFFIKYYIKLKLIMEMIHIISNLCLMTWIKKKLFHTILFEDRLKVFWLFNHSLFSLITFS